MSKCIYNLPGDCHNKDCLLCVLDKLRAEIVGIREDYQEFGWAYDDVLNIIDKYKEKNTLPLCEDVIHGDFMGVMDKEKEK